MAGLFREPIGPASLINKEGADARDKPAHDEVI
jgi:hypothetical protein